MESIIYKTHQKNCRLVYHFMDNMSNCKRTVLNIVYWNIAYFEGIHMPFHARNDRMNVRFSIFEGTSVRENVNQRASISYSKLVKSVSAHSFLCTLSGCERMSV